MSNAVFYSTTTLTTTVCVPWYSTCHVTLPIISPSVPDHPSNGLSVPTNATSVSTAAGATEALIQPQSKSLTTAAEEIYAPTASKSKENEASGAVSESAAAYSTSGASLVPLPSSSIETLVGGARSGSTMAESSPMALSSPAASAVTSAGVSSAKNNVTTILPGVVSTFVLAAGAHLTTFGIIQSTLISGFTMLVAWL